VIVALKEVMIKKNIAVQIGCSVFTEIKRKNRLLHLITGSVD
jgi:hypothetical protein